MLRKFLMVNEERECKHPATFMYDDETKKFSVEIPKDAELDDLPAVFKAMLMKGIYSVDDRVVRMFIKDRIIPPGRQNIGAILRTIGIIRYDEFEVLIYNKGRSCQDGFILEEIHDE